MIEVYRDANGQPLAPARLPRDEDRRPTASVFDQLVASNLALTVNVAKLVRLTYGVLLFNAVLVAIVIATMGRH